VLIDADWRSIELRLTANIYQDSGERLLALNPEIDAHALMAAKIYGLSIPEDGVVRSCDVSAHQRSIGKTANFALGYGCGVNSLMERLSLAQDRPVSYEEASRVYRAWRAQHPGIVRQMERYENHRITECRSVSGRRIIVKDRSTGFHLPMGRTNGVNYPIQASGKDLLADAVALLWSRLAEYPTSHFVALVHDEILIECDRKDSKCVAKLVKEAMEDPGLQSKYLGDIPLIADVKIGDTWADVH